MRPALLLVALAATAQAAGVSLSNVRLPIDTQGCPLITGEVDVLRHGGAYYFCLNDWGDCSGRDCCTTKGGCWSCCMRHHGEDALPSTPFAAPSPPQPEDSDCTDFFNHTIVAYKSTDLVMFEPLGSVFSLDPALGIILYRPHVLYSPVLKQFVMWYKTLVSKSETGTPAEHWYGVAAAASPASPFEIVVHKVPGLWQGDGGTMSDHFLFLDDDGSAYFSRYHSVQKLNATFTGFAADAALLPSPASWEAPILFKRGNRYFVIGGHNCCACKGGSNAFVH